jgi:hypothetical protein
MSNSGEELTTGNTDNIKEASSTIVPGIVVTQEAYKRYLLPAIYQVERSPGLNDEYQNWLDRLKIKFNDFNHLSLDVGVISGIMSVAGERDWVILQGAVFETTAWQSINDTKPMWDIIDRLDEILSRKTGLTGISLQGMAQKLMEQNHVDKTKILSGFALSQKLVNQYKDQFDGDVEDRRKYLKHALEYGDKVEDMDVMNPRLPWILGYLRLVEAGKLTRERVGFVAEVFSGEKRTLGNNDVNKMREAGVDGNLIKMVAREYRLFNESLDKAEEDINKI